MIARTQRYLNSLRDHNEILMVPTPVVAEYLQGFERGEQVAQLKKFERYFFTPSFDLPSAAMAAELSRLFERKDLDTSGDRRSIKVDTQIVATAIVHGADVIVTNDTREYEIIAAGRIKVSNVPDVAEQTRMF
jgi:predicted nucleic acid-binding protein